MSFFNTAQQRDVAAINCMAWKRYCDEERKNNLIAAFNIAPRCISTARYSIHDSQDEKRGSENGNVNAIGVSKFAEK